MRRFLLLLPALLASSLLAAPSARAEDELPPTSEFFDEYDANADGVVSKDEFRGSSEIFRLLDKNDDGEIKPDELGLPADYKPDPKAQQRRQAEAKRAARGGNAGQAMQKLYDRVMKLDADGDGRVSAAEWKGKEGGFARLDRNKDGFIDAKDGGMALGGRQRGGATKNKGKGKGKGKGGGMAEGRDPVQAEKRLEEARRRFAGMDKNADGKVTAEELPTPEFLDLLDKNKDGGISEDEFMAWVKQRARSGSPQGRRGRDGGRRRGRLNAGRLRSWDRDKDGKVTPDEFPGRDEMFKRLDADKDGVLTEADLKAANAGGRRNQPKKAKGPVTPKSGNLIERGDQDGDGRLHRAEFAGSAAEWRSLDKNEDGWITPDEIGAK